MKFRQRLYWLITFRWLVEWWIGPRAVALEHVTEKHKKAKTALLTVHSKLVEIEGRIVANEADIAKSTTPNRAKLYELRTHRAELAKLRKREKVLTDRVDELGEILSRFELDDEYQSLSEQDQAIVRSISDRLTQQGREAQVDAEISADSKETIEDAINTAGLDEELAALDREIKAKHAPKSAEPEQGKILPFPVEKTKEPVKDRSQEARDAAARAEAVAQRLEKKAELDPNKGFVIMPDDEPPPAKERQLDFG